MTQVNEGDLLGPVDGLLQEFSGKRCYFEHEGGNNGDVLIRNGSLLAIERAGINFTDDPDEADLIIVRGGGGMNDFMPGTLDRITEILKRYMVPIVVLPQSYKFLHFDFPKLFANREAPVFLYARESISLNLLRDMDFPPSVRIGIDHDMAMALAGGEFVSGLRDRAKKRHILIVERRDVESVEPVVQKPFPFPRLRDRVPYQVRVKLKRVFRRAMAAGKSQTAFARETGSVALDQYPEFSKDPIISMDISDIKTASFENFCSLIAEASIVITNRLHVGILAALLEKPTYLAEGSYHKIRGIYHYSLSDMNHVRLIK